MPDRPDDADRLLADARAGSPAALGAALEAYRNYLLGIADREIAPALKAKGGASDIVQETFLEAQRDFAGFRGDTDDDLRAALPGRLDAGRCASVRRDYRRVVFRGRRRR